MKTDQIKKQAYRNFESGLHCAEVVSKTVLDNLSEEPHPGAVKASSYLGGGIAGTMEELCGAFTGGVLALGVILGRENPGETMKEGAEIVKKYKAWFIKEYGSVNCPTLISGFSEEEGLMGCVNLTADATACLAELLSDFEKENHIDVGSFCRQPRDKVALGECPFSGCSC